MRLAREWTSYLGPLLLSVALAASIGFVGTRGDFPLNDDFAYARSTLVFLDTGRFERLAWTYTPIVTNVAIGVAASEMAGFSFGTLRASTLLFAWLGAMGMYVLCRQHQIGPARATLAAAVLAFNPVQLALSFTFMTDVPFVALTTWSQVFAVAWFGTQRRRYLIGALTLAALACLSRQTGVALFGAFGLAAIAARGLRHPIRYLAGAGAALVMYFALEQVLSEAGPAGNYFTLLRALSKDYDLHATVDNIAIVSAYLGAFVLPVVALSPTLRASSRAEVLWASLGAVTVIALGIAVVKVRELSMPPGLNVLIDLGIGPRILHGAARTARAPQWVWWVLCCAGWGVLGWTVARVCPRALKTLAAPPPPTSQRAVRLVVPLFLFAFLLPHLPRAPLFDRYLLAVLPGALVWLLDPRNGSGLRGTAASRPARLPWLACGTAAVALAASSVAATHDYMEHHRARWRLIHRAEALGATSMELDGGFEYLAWRNYAPWPAEHLAKSTYRYWLNDDRYLLTLEPVVAGYDPWLEEGYRRHLPPGTETLRILRRRAADAR